MKKMMLFAALCCMCVAFGLSSCGENKVELGYGIGISTESQKATGDDFFNFCNYLREKQVPFEGDDTYVRFEGKNQAECDAKAIEYFEMQTAKLNYDEIAAFIQYPEDFFVNYRIVSATHAEGQEGRILGSWIYPPAK